MRAFSFANTILLINGVEITGWAEGDDVIKIERSNDSASHKIGAGGEMMVSLSTDKSGKVTFKLQQTSSSNVFLSKLCNLQDGGVETFVPVNVKFQDTYRQDTAEGTVGYITKDAPIQRGAQAGETEWSVNVERLDMLLGDQPDVVV